MKTRLTEFASSLFKGDTINLNKEEFEVISVKRKFHNGQAIQMDVNVRSKADGFCKDLIITPKNVYDFA